MSEQISSINERIALMIEKLGLNPNSFAVKLGIKNAQIYQIIGGRKSKPSFELLEKILQTFEDINGHWLLTGEGKIMKENEQSLEINKAEILNYLTIINWLTQINAALLAIQTRLSIIEGYCKQFMDDPKKIESA